MSRYIYTADWHIRATSPRIRKDMYADTQFKKIVWILELAEEKKADVVVAGDIFNTPSCPLWLLNRYIQLFQGFENNIFAIPGQHDMHFHNPDLENTPLGVLYNSGAVLFPDDDDVRGVRWEGNIPNRWSEVLVLHECITPDTPPFFLKNAISGVDAIKNYGDTADVIVSGDYHQHHVTITDNNILCNPGPIMRAAKDKMEYDPCVFFYENGSIEMISIPIEQDVFNERALEEDDRKEYSVELREFLDAIGVKEEVADFVVAMDAVAEVMKISRGVERILNQIKENFRGRDSK